MPRFVSSSLGALRPRVVAVSAFFGRLALGAVLLWSGMAKIRHPYQFLDSVYGYEVLGPRGTLVAACTLPWVELCIGACLLINAFPPGALLGAAMLFGAFVAAQTSVLLRGLHISCGCFLSDAGAGEDSVSLATIARSAAFAAVAVVLLLAALSARHAAAAARGASRSART